MSQLIKRVSVADALAGNLGLSKPKRERFRPFPERDGRYGAPMGRVSASLDPDLSPDDLAVAGPAGEYDAGGVYWGTSPTEGPVWAVWHKGHGHEGVAYVRAFSAERAKMIALDLEEA